MKMQHIMMCLMIFIITSFVCSTFLSEKNNEEDTINVHVIPHTHDDAGWVLTIQEYYDQRVKNILDNMMVSLKENPDRTFIYVEQAFFTMWYPSQSEDTKNTLKEWLKNGRFEFIMGGYVMHDESASHFQHVIDQMRLGLQFLKSEFNFTPTIAWFIDPFGHSASNAYILKEMGFETIVFVRIDYKEKNIRRANKTMEFNWRPYFDLANEKIKSITKKKNSDVLSDPKDTSIFTHITAEHYCPFDNFGRLNEDRIVKFTDEELNQEVKRFVEQVKKQSAYYMHKELIYWFGCDFTFQKASINYNNLEPIMKKVNENKDFKVNVFYSTPTKYFSKIKNLPIEYPSYENNDFFPYADDEFSYWTGYFTSRPNLKVRVREAGNVLERVSNILVEDILNGNNTSVDDYLKTIFNLREKLAICQHHDAVAGTSKNYVSVDYENMLFNSSKDTTTKVIDKILGNQLKKDVKSCVLGYSNFECEDVDSNFDNQGFSQIVFYNNRINDSNFTAKLRLRSPKVEVYKNDKKTKIESDIICQHSHELDKEFPCYIFFNLTLLKDYPINSIFLKKINEERQIIGLKQEENPKLVLNNVTFTLKHSYYIGYNGDETSCETKPKGKNPDGAYIFSTCSNYPVTQNVMSVYKYTSKIVEYQYSIEFKNSYIHIRKFSNSEFLEVESQYDPFKNDDKNHILHLESDINNTLTDFSDKSSKIEMWTDSNGLKMMRRIKDFRRDWQYTVTDPVSGNFYPINFAASLRERSGAKKYDSNDYNSLSNMDRTITVYNERSQSVGFMNQGEIMILLQRSSIKDDQRGKDEPLFEETSASRFYTFNHYISANTKNESKIYNKIHYSPFISTSNNSKTLDVFSTSKLNSIINTNCLINIQVLSSKQFYLQLFNRNDPYFIGRNNESTCHYKVNFESINQFEITEIPKNGISGFESKKSQEEKNLITLLYDYLSNLNFKLNINEEYLLDYQEFKLFKITIKS